MFILAIRCLIRSPNSIFFFPVITLAIVFKLNLVNKILNQVNLLLDDLFIDFPLHFLDRDGTFWQLLERTLQILELQNRVQNNGHVFLLVVLRGVNLHIVTGLGSFRLLHDPLEVVLLLGH